MAAEAAVIKPETLDATTKDPTTDLTFKGNDMLLDCRTWFDGCNRCSVRDGRIGRCGRTYCRTRGTAYCMIKEAKADIIKID
jgi:hypothetical protein